MPRLARQYNVTSKNRERDSLSQFMPHGDTFLGNEAKTSSPRPRGEFRIHCIDEQGLVESTDGFKNFDGDQLTRLNWIKRLAVLCHQDVYAADIRWHSGCDGSA